MDERYSRNLGTISEEKQKLLAEKRVCVVGCGGLGGYVIETLVRMGVGELTVVDGDVFDITNLNRQRLSSEENLGVSKAQQAAEQMSKININVKINAVFDRFDEKNYRSLLEGCELVVDAVDNVESRLLLEAACCEAGIPLVHGAIAGWCGQVAICMPGKKLLEKIYDGLEAGAELETGNPAFTPAIIGNIQAAETIKLLTGKKSVLENRLLMVDLLEHSYEIIEGI